MKKADWRGFIEVASFMNKQTSSFKNPEYLFRTVISRSYYASYHCAKLWGKTNGYYQKNSSNEKKSDHRDVEALIETFIPDLYDKYNDLLFWRETSDYFNDCALNYARIAADSISLAEFICDKLESDLSEHGYVL